MVESLKSSKPGPVPEQLQWYTVYTYKGIRLLTRMSIILMKSRSCVMVMFSVIDYQPTLIVCIGSRAFWILTKTRSVGARRDSINPCVLIKLKWSHVKSVFFYNIFTFNISGLIMWNQEIHKTHNIWIPRRLQPWRLWSHIQTSEIDPKRFTLTHV